MLKVKDYFGCNAQEAQPAENHFSLPLVYSGALLVFFAYLALLQWPASGIPSALQQYNLQLEGGTYWVADKDLPAYAKVLAWVAFAWKFFIYITLTALMYRLARTFYTKADFTSRVFKTLKAAQLTLLIGMIVYSILVHFVGRAVQQASGLAEFTQIPTFLSDQGLLTFLFLVALFFIEGALHRGLTLQEDVDATI
ncbi:MULTISPECIES: hypothetical protein [unclassified Rothia (in: high G+C Gram-positive bacteria)]|uniref:hypothetical protein n=1 Tax=unclassified Rothia (in: high G+C Gram-positive bacteria) TaxID=2689056 RepID=UPI001959B86F|nr:MULTISPECIES: hypothetical protein [unclassified Rothia (in: high G+C Gram-positive bacteria)]MBM7051679.1 hypothetical protein [Rothia sp. ZJ1223]QRZ61684.1 hypothetical protein JR346_00615 [Rothia sp. ZJ932]